MHASIFFFIFSPLFDRETPEFLKILLKQAELKKKKYRVPLKRSSVSIIRIRLREVSKCLAFNDLSQSNSNNTH